VTTLAVRSGTGPAPTRGADETVSGAGTDVAGYRVDPAPRGRGRFGTVLGAVRRRDGSAVALELFDVAPDQQARGLTELATLLDLPASPHVLPVLDVGTADDGRIYVAYPRAERSLALPGAPLPAEALRDAATDAALGLVALHGADLLHGGVAPASVVGLANGRWALTPPAVPVLAEADDSPHRPPEVRRGGDWSVAGDLWSLGSTLRAAGTLPDDVGEVVGALLEDDPGCRPRDAQEVLDRLRRTADDRSADPLATAGPGAPVGTVRAPAGRPLGSGYLLEEPIGRGATGQVWRGVRRHDGSPVAVKLLRSELAEDPEVVARFLAERSVVTRVASPYVVTVHDLVAESGTLAIVMDLVDGADLRRTLAGGTLTAGEGLRVLAQVAHGLAAVHAAGIVHRDLKPENVLVRRADGEVHAWLTDFGVARTTSGPSAGRLTRASRLVGTPEYVAPELAAGRAATPAVDVYAWGVLAYEVLSGRRPFDADHPAALLRAHLEDAPARPPGLDPQVWVVLAACLAKDPAERPDATTAAARLEAAGSGATADAGGALAPLPETAEGDGETPPPYLPPPVADLPLPTAGATRPAPPAAPVAPPRRDRRRTWAAVGALLVIALAAAGVGAWLGRPDDGANRTRTRPRTATTSGPVAVAAVADSPRRGEVRVRFPSGAELSGVQFFIVYRDDTVALSHVDPADDEWTFRNLDPGTRHCWQVVALVTTTGDLPKRRTPDDACAFANGKSQ
jgi:hypothetical protein